MILKFGFQDIPYSQRQNADVSPLSIRRRRVQIRTKTQRRYGEGKTTAQVAKELEAKYHIVETFYKMEKEYIHSLIGAAIVEPFIHGINGRDHPATIPQEALNQIMTRFRTNLSRKKYDNVIPGVPTTASLRGYQHLFAHSFAKRPVRPSFVDTGMYQSTFKAWVED